MYIHIYMKKGCMFRKMCTRVFKYPILLHNVIVANKIKILKRCVMNVTLRFLTWQ